MGVRFTPFFAFSSKYYSEVEVDKNCFVYLDPPYLASQAVYSENGEWNQDKEQKLLDYMDALDAKGIAFALSNVFENKGKKNALLIAWSAKYTVHYLCHAYHNCNYHAKNKSKSATVEVLITNY